MDIYDGIVKAVKALIDQKLDLTEYVCALDCKGYAKLKNDGKFENYFGRQFLPIEIDSCRYMLEAIPSSRPKEVPVIITKPISPALFSVEAHPLRNDNFKGLRFEWIADIGWGQYDLWYDEEAETWKADSETLDSKEDKSFLKQLLSAWAESVEVEG